MKSFFFDSVTKLYYTMLCSAIEEYDETLTFKSRVGQVYDLGQVYFSVDNDGFRMPLLLKRGFNPFFALVEFACLIKGDNLLLPLQKVLPSYDQYSDDQKTLNGAYGARLRKYFGYDQIERAIALLRKSSTSRRALLQLWSADDLGKISNDIPCNTQIMLKIRQGKLWLTVTNRSNDIFRGIPYNIFLFYMLQKYIAHELKCEVGPQCHFTDSLHVYSNDIIKIKDIITSCKNLDFSKFSVLEKSFSWDILMNDAQLLDFFSDIPYDNISEEFHEDKNNIFYFNKKEWNVIHEFQKISENPLALINLLWHDTFKKISPITHFFNGFFALKNKVYFENYQNSDAMTLMIGAKLFAITEKNRIEQIKKLIFENHIIEISDQEKFLQTAFIASVLAYTDKQIPVQLQQLNFSHCKSACEQLNLDEDILNKLIPFVQKIWK